MQDLWIIAVTTWVVCANIQFSTVRFFSWLFLFLQLAPRSHQWTNQHQNWHVSAFSAKDVPFGGLDDDQSRLGVQTPKNQNFRGLNRHFKPNLQKNQIVISSKLCIGLAKKLKGRCDPMKRLRGWSYMMMDGRHLEFQKVIIIQSWIEIFAWNFV